MSATYSHLRDNSQEFELHLLLEGQQNTQVSSEVDVTHAKSLALYTKGNSSAVAGGTVLIEGSPISAHPGTWKSLGSITVPAGTALGAVSVTDGDDGFPTRFVRARISGQIANGNVDVYLVVQR